jgi:hypothetical protein
VCRSPAIWRVRILELHFGLGVGEKVESMEVWWPDGPVESAGEIFPGADVNQFLQLRRGEGRAMAVQEAAR